MLFPDLAGKSLRTSEVAVKLISLTESDNRTVAGLSLQLSHSCDRKKLHTIVRRNISRGWLLVA